MVYGLCVVGCDDWSGDGAFCRYRRSNRMDMDLPSRLRLQPLTSRLSWIMRRLMRSTLGLLALEHLPRLSMHKVHRSARRGNKGGGGRRPPRSGMKHDMRRGRQGVGGDAAHRKRAMVSLRPQCVCQNLISCSSLFNVAIGPFDWRTPSRVSRLQERCMGCRFATAAL